MRGTMRRLTALCVILATLFVMTGCGQKKYKVDKGIQLDKQWFIFEKVERVTDKDTDSTKCYGVSLLLYGKKTPVNINLNTKKTTVRYMVVLNSGDEVIKPKDIQFETLDKMINGYGVRGTYLFHIPVDSELPKVATLSDENDKTKTALLDIASAGVE